MSRARALRITVYRSVPWLVFGAVLLPAFATLVVGIVLVALWDAPGDLALGILTLVFGVFALTGAILTLVLLVRQNRLVRAQAEFIASVSHELRTPMASIRLCAETLKLRRFENPAEEAAVVADLDRESSRLALLVEQLLGMRDAASEVRAPGLQLETVAEEIVASFRRDPEHAHRLSLVVEPELPPIPVNEEGFRQALSNLVDNALKHGGTGPVIVTLRADAAGVSCDVRDRGPGIPPDQLQRLFARFERGQDAIDANVPGLGLGLSIVHAFAEAHQGRVQVKDAPIQGCIFSLWLPGRPR